MHEEPNPATPSWRVSLIACVLLFTVLLALFWSTVSGMVFLWYDKGTYNHGFLILPISLWLIWQKRAHLAVFTPQPSWGFLVLVGGSLLLWALARLTGTLVVEQFSFVAVLVTALASVLGLQISKFLAFPLLFLFFAVPMGEDLVPPMMEFTATFTVEALKLTGIPVYRDGLWFSLPTGNWSVVQACSGVRYLIASVTLGVMYAYITYHTLWKRLLFIAMSAIVPIIANGLRAYMIVMIGHLSKMEYATGVDHLIYGWFFFGVVMFILFWIGSFWQEQQEPLEFVAPPRMINNHSVILRVLSISVIVVLAAASTVAATRHVENIETAMAGTLDAPDAVAEWRPAASPTLWSAVHLETPHKIEAVYTDGESEVQLFVVLFPQQRQGDEAINPENRIAAALSKFDRLPGGLAETDDQQMRVNRAKAVVSVQGKRHEHLVWQWYRVAGRSLTNRYEGKAWEALARVYPGRADGAWIAITTPLDHGDIEVAEGRLARFARSVAPEIGASIDAALGQANR